MDLRFRIAEQKDAAGLDDMLKQLSVDLGDTHRATVDDLRRAGWGPFPAFRGVIAEVNDDPLGVALYSACFSTVLAGTGCYVSDLWTAPQTRGQGVGKGLLKAALEDSEQVWGATFVKLAVYHGSHNSRRFYENLGFTPVGAQTEMILGEAGCAALRGHQ